MLDSKHKRQYERLPAQNVGLVETLAVLPHGSMKKVGSSLLFDRSKHGLAIVLDSPLSIGTRLVLRNRYVEYAGVVRHCQRLEMGYKVGLLLTSQ